MTHHPTLSRPLLPALRRATAATALCAASLAAAADPGSIEARAQAVAEELRCLVCQNETVAGSTAPLALDLRAQIRQQLAAGRSEREVMDYMTARYGDFVRYRPPVDARTWLLWWGPFALLALGGLGLWRRLRQPGAPVAEGEA